MASSKAKSVTAAAAFFFAALTLATLVACEGPGVSQPAPKPSGSQPPSTGSNMVVRCGVCKGTGGYLARDGYRKECENCNGTGKVKYNK